MATSTILSNPEVKFGAVDLTGWCTSAVLTKTVTALNDTVFGNTSNTFTAGLEDNELVVTLFLSYAASATYATLAPLVGTKFNVTVKPTSAADSATNPAFTLTNTYLESLPVISASLGELQSIDITTMGGVYSVDVTP
jgi:Ca2+-binding RTX toxin-like protein